MRLLVWFGIIWMTFGAAAHADAPQPAELPPRDFAGTQFIDSAGCVFLRAAQGWVAALTDDQAQVCGFPPSRTIWPGMGSAPLSGSPDDAAAKIERDLTMLMVTAEGAGMALDDAVDLSAIGRRAAPSDGAGTAGPAAADGAKDGIDAEIARGLALREQIGAMAPSYPASGERLCALLGLRQAGADPVAIGDDPTGGLCSGRAASIAGYRLRDAAAALTAADAQTGQTTGLPGRRLAVGAANPADAAVKDGRPSGSAGAAKPRADGAPVLAPQKAGGATAARGDGPAAVQRSAPKAELVAPGARFVQIGRFDQAAVEIAAKGLARLGYPVVRETRLGADGKRFVMAGPFTTRADLITALDAIRRAGYGGAVAR